ncbi:MAG: adenylosuccinate synthetase [Candidatus Heimdallarchaeota archaeon]|nr:adenylosuccinate synthetase [Candidatus Heimdallarchaeota archaeon]MCK5049786.1 adenylosuccinate synthetase [Candidatus Heimdallarchaeota archaeon]
MKEHKCTVLTGGFFGDEGKGKLAAYISLKDKPELVVRGGVGPNAGHTVIYNEVVYKLRQLPAGFLNERSRVLISPGMLVNPEVLLKELEVTKIGDRLGVDYQSGIILPKHVKVDKEDSHLTEKIGTSGAGTGPANQDRIRRSAPLARDIPELEPYLTDTVQEIHESFDRNEHVFLEGSQATYLSLYHGTYPYVTSKDVAAAALCSDAGVGPTDVTDVITVFKAFVTRVGEGPLEGELDLEEMNKRKWTEYGTVTGRARRAAPFNYEMAKRAIRINSTTQIGLTKIDILFPECEKVQNYEEISSEAKVFIEKLEKEVKVPVTLIGTGPDMYDIIDRREELGLF